MILTRATDNRLKAFFTGNEVRWGDVVFQGKGYRSLGQEAIYAACLRLRRGDNYRTADGVWRGTMVDAPRGAGGFGYDPHFLVPAFGKTAAELTSAEKNAVSHRGQALRSLVDKLVDKLK